MNFRNLSKAALILFAATTVLTSTSMAQLTPGGPPPGHPGYGGGHGGGGRPPGHPGNPGNPPIGQRPGQPSSAAFRHGERVLVINENRRGTVVASYSDRTVDVRLDGWNSTYSYRESELAKAVYGVKNIFTNDRVRVSGENSRGVVVTCYTNGTVDVKFDHYSTIYNYPASRIAKELSGPGSDGFGNEYRYGDRVLSNNGYRGTVQRYYQHNQSVDVRWDVNGAVSNWSIYDISRIW